MVILDKLQEILSGNKEAAGADTPATQAPLAEVPANDEAIPAANSAAAEAALAESFLAAANDDASASPTTQPTQPEFSLTNAANELLKQQLQSQTLMRYGHEHPVAFPVDHVAFTEQNSDFAYIPSISSDEPDARPHGKQVSLSITLSNPATDYDTVALKAAPATLLGSIPMFQGKIIAKPANDAKPTYQDVGKELGALLAANPDKFSKAELDVIEQFFEAHLSQKDEASRWGGSITVDHHDGIVSMRIEAAALPKDKDAVISSDNEIVEFFNAHHDMILKHVKEKVAALGVVTAEELAKVDMHVAAKGWSIEAKFGEKPASDVDAAGEKLTPEAYGKKMTASPLAKIDTKVLDKIFTEALLESNKELPPIMARIMDGPMLADILRKRLPGNEQIEALLAKHDLFKDAHALKVESDRAAANHAITLGDTQISKAIGGKADELTISFELPPGVKLQEVLASIISAKAKPDNTVTEPAKIGMLEAANVNLNLGAGAAVA